MTTSSTAPDDARIARLEEILARAAQAAQGDLRARLQWLEDAALAADACDLGDLGKKGALDLKAALGAVVRYAQGPRDPKGLDELEAVVRLLTARGVASIYAALAHAWDAVVDEPGAPMRAQAKLLADAFRALSTSIARGEPASPAALRAILDVKRSLDEP